MLCLGLSFALYYVLTIPLDVQVAKFIQKHHANQVVLESLKATSQGKGLLIPKK